MIADQTAPSCTSCLLIGQQTPATHADGRGRPRRYCDRHSWPGDLLLLDALGLPLGTDAAPEDAVSAAVEMPTARTWPEPCHAERQDDPRWDVAADTFDPPPGTWAPDCGHAACVEDAAQCPGGGGWHDWECPVAACRYEASRDTCSLEAGHEGEHRFRLPAVSGPRAEGQR